MLLERGSYSRFLKDSDKDISCPSAKSGRVMLGPSLRNGLNVTISVVGHPIVDVVIATPKTFLKHLRLTPGFSLKLVSHLVLDEADRMVDMVIHG